MLNEAFLLAQNKQLRERIEELEEEVRLLKAKEADQADELPAGLPHLTTIEERVLRALLSKPGRLRLYGFIYDAIYRGETERDPQVVKVMVSRLRKKVSHMVQIETLWGRGYTATLVNEKLRGPAETGVSSNSEQQAA